MRVSSNTIDLLIILIFEAVTTLAKISKGEEITKEDLKLEKWEETVARVKKELGIQ